MNKFHSCESPPPHMNLYCRLCILLLVAFTTAKHYPLRMLGNPPSIKLYVRPNHCLLSLLEPSAFLEFYKKGFWSELLRQSNLTVGNKKRPIIYKYSCLNYKFNISLKSLNDWSGWWLEPIQPKFVKIHTIKIIREIKEDDLIKMSFFFLCELKQRQGVVLFPTIATN